MKAHRPIAAALSVLTLSSAAPAQTPPPSPAAQEDVVILPAPHIQCSYSDLLKPGVKILISFDVPMVSAD